MVIIFVISSWKRIFVTFVTSKNRKQFVSRTGGLDTVLVAAGDSQGSASNVKTTQKKRTEELINTEFWKNNIFTIIKKIIWA